MRKLITEMKAHFSCEDDILECLPVSLYPGREFFEIWRFEKLGQLPRLKLALMTVTSQTA